MTPDLTYLALTALLTVVLWIPYIAAQTMAKGIITATDYKDVAARSKEMPDWVTRMNRAHINAVESFGPFAAVVLVVHVAGAANETTATAALVYFWARVAHAIVMYLGWPYIRTVIFAIGFIATVVIGLQVLI